MIRNTEPNSENRSIEEKRQRYKTIRVTSCRTSVGDRREEEKNDCYDDKCERLVKERNVARIKMLQRRTRRTVSEYTNKRRLEKKGM
jgi:hypothetical protein